MAIFVNIEGVGSVILGVGTQPAQCDSGVGSRDCAGSTHLVVVTYVICVDVKC